MEEKKLQLQKQLQELLDWKRSLEVQQVQKPIGRETKVIVEKDLLVSTGKFGEVISTDCYLEVSIDGTIWWLGADEK